MLVLYFLLLISKLNTATASCSTHIGDNNCYIITQTSVTKSITSEPPAGYRSLNNNEKTAEISKIAKSLLGGAMGTQTPFSIDGKQYMARVEVHYHPPPPPNASAKEKAKYPKPWGNHKGVTVYRLILQEK